MRKLKFLVKIGIVGAVILFSVFFLHSGLRKGKTVRISQGATFSGIAPHLKSRDIIFSEFLFKALVHATGGSKSLKSGTYFFPTNSSMWSVYRTLTTGRTVFSRLTLSEGLTVQQIVKAIEKSPQITGPCPEGVKEGMLLPETYFFDFGSTCAAVLGQMEQMMQKALDKAWEGREAGLPLKSKEEMLVLASIVEKETAKAEERPQVASVFINRLRKGMKLQTDPTVVYAITNGYGHMQGKRLLLRDLKVDSPYNTYKHKGLPPAPIANPGRASLEAVAHPDKTPYLFFVADGTGGHVFAKTNREHEENRQEWRKIRKQKEQAGLDLLPSSAVKSNK
ncbi:MAG: endolytic transglycosylase MltG [Alphaproteobacteria bacterium]|nr:endolytic transglycosylase MltG [Alphaproteobacteria bacterium]